MSKKKSKKIEKETRRLMESMSDLVKKKGNGRYKFKTGKKKTIKKIKKTCVHWIMRKGKDTPTVIQDPEHPKNWKCTICGASFPIRPLEPKKYNETANELLSYVNQMQFWSVKMGGDAEDTKLFIDLKNKLSRLVKIQRNILKQVDKRQKWEDRKEKTDSLSQFDSYSGYNYRA